MIDPIQEELNRFVAFGTLLDRKTRGYLAQYLHAQLEPDRAFPEELNDSYYQYFSQAIDQIFEATKLQELCLNKPRLSQQVTADLLFWMRKAFQIIEGKHPYQDEETRLGAAAVTPLAALSQQWKTMTRYLQETYPKEELNIGFYREKFSDLFDSQSADGASDVLDKEIERIFHDLLAQWDARFQTKLLQWQLRKLDEDREQFQDLLEAKVEEYNKIHSLISPFAEYVGKYWDMSRDLWQNTSFDVLERYDELLQDEDSIRKLADMLGKMREAEIITEEETYEKTIVRQEWVSDPTQRTEIIGSHASDDLNNLMSSEVGLLSDPDTETVFLKRYADKQLQTFRFEDQKLIESEEVYSETYTRTKQKEKGPFIICIDTSESMAGPAEQIAKVLCFAILKMAGKENRRAFLINFSTGIKVIDLKDIGASLDAIAAFLQMSFQGGTDISPALYEVMRQLEGESYRDADVLVISDFILYTLDEDIIGKIRYHQQNNGTQFHSLTLHEDPNAEVIAQFDSNWIYDPEKKGIVQELAGKLRGMRR